MRNATHLLAYDEVETRIGEILSDIPPGTRDNEALYEKMIDDQEEVRDNLSEKVSFYSIHYR